MGKNIGSIDKVIRLILAVALFSLFFLLEGNSLYIALAGFIPLLTSFVSFCPIYKILGMRTNSTKK